MSVQQPGPPPPDPVPTPPPSPPPSQNGGFKGILIVALIGLGGTLGSAWITTNGKSSESINCVAEIKAAWELEQLSKGGPIVHTGHEQDVCHINEALATMRGKQP